MKKEQFQELDEDLENIEQQTKSKNYASPNVKSRKPPMYVSDDLQYSKVVTEASKEGSKERENEENDETEGQKHD